MAFKIPANHGFIIIDPNSVMVRCMKPDIAIDFDTLAQQIKLWGRQLGLQKVAIADTDLATTEMRLQQWLSKGYHGNMDYMHKHGSKRTRAEELVPGTLRVISVRLDYLPDEPDPTRILQDPAAAFISRYALGRDYHKTLRSRLKKLAQQIEQQVGPIGYRVFVDSAPVMEKAIAAKAGLGWVGKHSNILSREAGSWFFLGEIYTNLPLPVDLPVTDHCGDCTACIDICPTRAIVAPYVVDARRCISYLTIELHDAIPVDLRPLLGNRIYGCDDCQQVCPWNRFARASSETDFQPRHGLDQGTLIDFFGWSEQTFLKNTEGSPIRRIGHTRWLRNIAVALGNGNPAAEVERVLQQRLTHASALVVEHTEWALERLQHKQPAG